MKLQRLSFLGQLFILSDPLPLSDPRACILRMQSKETTQGRHHSGQRQGQPVERGEVEIHQNRSESYLERAI